MLNGNTISYRKVGDYNIPNLTLPLEEANIRLGKWGMLHKDYLCKHKKAVFTILLTEGKLYHHCADIENQAKAMFDTLVEQIKEAEGVTEQLKEGNQLEWGQQMNSIQYRATEIVNQMLIYANLANYTSKVYCIIRQNMLSYLYISIIWRFGYGDKIFYYNG